MHANFSLRRVRLKEAHAFTDLDSTPVTIEFETLAGNGRSYGGITLHVEDAALADALVQAINAARDSGRVPRTRTDRVPRQPVVGLSGPTPRWPQVSDDTGVDFAPWPLR
jgi:hypothetical protein